MIIYESGTADERKLKGTTEGNHYQKVWGGNWEKGMIGVSRKELVLTDMKTARFTV